MIRKKSILKSPILNRVIPYDCENNPLPKKFVGGDDRIVLIYEAKVSTYLLDGVVECISKLDDDEYILCVGYKGSKGGDFQIGLTGTSKKNEDIDQTAKRETMEEVGIEFDEFLKETSKIHKYTSHVYTVNIKNCNATKWYNSSKKKDDKSRKVTVLIHGPLNSIVKVMKTIPVEKNNGDNIGYYIALKISEAKSICKYIKKKKIPKVGNKLFL